MKKRKSQNYIYSFFPLQNSTLKYSGQHLFQYNKNEFSTEVGDFINIIKSTFDFYFYFYSAFKQYGYTKT